MERKIIQKHRKNNLDPLACEILSVHNLLDKKIPELYHNSRVSFVLIARIFSLLAVNFENPTQWRNKLKGYVTKMCKKRREEHSEDDMFSVYSDFMDSCFLINCKSPCHC